MVLLGIVLLGLVLFPKPTIYFFTCAGLLTLLRPVLRWGKRKLLSVIAVVAPIVIINILFAVVPALHQQAITSFLNPPPPSPKASPAPKASATPKAHAKLSRTPALHALWPILLLLVLTWGAEFVYRLRIYRTLVESLKLGALPPPRKSRPEDRISMVERARRGNITLFSIDDPFIGTGVNAAPERQWSIAIRLTPADPARRAPYAPPVRGDWQEIDPVELHEAIRQKLQNLSDSGLQVNERINKLGIRDRLAGRGALYWDNQLVDRKLRMPYSHASQEAIAAIIRHPQAHLRYYQHVLIDDEGPLVTTDDDQKILNATDQGISISAFVYTAVEGRHFYLQFILTALRPIKPEYRAIDLLPVSRRKIPRSVLRDATIEFIPATADSVDGIVRSGIQSWREHRSKRKALHDESPVGDLGARISVRELGMTDGFGSYIKRLDVEKYSSIIERAVLEAAQDFLAGKGVDISAFNEHAATIISGNVFGTISGGTNQFGGTDNTINQQHDGHARRPRFNRARQQREPGIL